MADDEDVRALQAGDKDLARRDLRGENFSGLDLTGVDLSGAHVERADFSGAILVGANIKGSHTSGLVAQNANLSRINANSTVIFAANLQNANLQKANFSAAHITRSDFSNADVRGADFRKAKINEGTLFKNCTWDEDTLFDGAEVFRPLARESVFTNYRVERGVLKRKEPVSPLNKSSERQPENYYLSKFDYSSNNGILVIENGHIPFSTKWSRAGGDSIHIYENPPSVINVGIAKGFNKIREINENTINNLDYSSRVRTVKEGEIVILKGTSGEAAIIKIIDVQSEGHGDPSDTLEIEYTFHSSQTASGANAETIEKIKEIEKRLNELESGLGSSLPAHGGIGHNNPPEPIPLSKAESADLKASLAIIKQEAQEGAPNLQRLSAAKEKIEFYSTKITVWIAEKLNIAVDEFAKQIGQTLGSTKMLMGSWLVLSGKMSELLELITKYFL